MHKGYALYLWLALFTVFVSFFSIILFNYVSGDIRVTKKLVKETNFYNTIKGIAVIATELNRKGHTKGEYFLKGIKYNFYTTRITQTRILVQVYANDDLIARVIVQDRKYLSDLNLYFSEKLEGETSLSSSTRYSTFATTAENMEVFGDNNVFVRAYISPSTVVNDKGPVEIKDNKGKVVNIEYENLKELQKYSQYASFISPNIDNFFKNYVVNIANNLGYRSQISRTFPDEVVDLTKYGSIFISGNNVESVYINFYPAYNSGDQEIKFSVKYKNKHEVDKYNYYLVMNPGTTVSVNVDNIITNDQFIINQIEYYKNISNNNIINVSLNNFSDYKVYKVLIKYDKDNNPIRSIIYRTRYQRTFIYSTHDIHMGSDSPGTFNGGIINSDILLVSSKNINIFGHIVYNEFDSIESFVNLAEGNSFTFPADSKSYLNVIANNVIINS
ncbi:MAG: hypothetical protein N2169_07055, partial [bacterium]|nr:hypothetical protein [bacterium]